MIKIVSLDFAGVIVSKDFIDYFWFVAIPRVIAKLERIPLYNAIKFVEKAYTEYPSDRIEWYLPSFWLDRFGLKHLEEKLIDESIELAEVYGDVFTALPILANRYTIVVATNTPRNIVLKVLSMYGLDKYVKHVFSCIDDVKTPKKNTLFYEFVISNLGVRPSEVVHVGDDPVYDGAVPSSIGIRTIILDRSARNRYPSDLLGVFEILQTMG